MLFKKEKKPKTKQEKTQINQINEMKMKTACIYFFPWEGGMRRSEPRIGDVRNCAFML